MVDNWAIGFLERMGVYGVTDMQKATSAIVFSRSMWAVMLERQGVEVFEPRVNEYAETWAQLFRQSVPLGSLEVVDILRNDMVAYGHILVRDEKARCTEEARGRLEQERVDREDELTRAISELNPDLKGAW